MNYIARPFMSLTIFYALKNTKIVIYVLKKKILGKQSLKFHNIKFSHTWDLLLKTKVHFL